MRKNRRARPARPRLPELPGIEALSLAPLANPLGIFRPGGKPRRRPRKTRAEQFALFDSPPAKDPR
jgi:hypothetical protein